jgi:hypothetical protein
LTATPLSALFTNGCSVAISGDTLAIGAIDEASNATGINGNQADNSDFIIGTGGSGAVYILR